MHHFAESLRLSHAAADLPLWEECYRAAFPDFAAMIDHRQDGPHQRAGVDRSVVLANAKQVLIDEKFRGRNKKTRKVYEDVALEYLSDSRRRTPGWVCKPLLADYIAYAIGPLGRAYLLPVLQLQQAWKGYVLEWLELYGSIEAVNDGWVTLSCPVPAGVLLAAIGECLAVTFTPCEGVT
jgi:hypothetical protein